MFVYQVTVGTNPLSVAAPGKDGDSFVLDMATSAVALGKVSNQIRESSFNMTRGDEDIEGGLQKFLDTRKGGL